MKTTRVLLCQTTTGRYFQYPANWTDQADLAHDFEHTTAAVLFALERKLGPVAVELAFEQSEFNLRLPLRCEGPAPVETRSTASPIEPESITESVDPRAAC